jgi:hypothetical protein
MLWQIKNHTLAGIFGFVGAKNSIIKSFYLKKVFLAIFCTYKINEDTTDLTTTLIKQL